MDVSDRRMQVQLTQEARIASDFSYIRAILAVVGFVSALGEARASPVVHPSSCPLSAPVASRISSVPVSPLAVKPM